MSRSTISTFELFQMFPDNDSARLYFEASGVASLSGNRPAGALVTWRSKRRAPRAVIPLGLDIRASRLWRKCDEHF